MNNFKSFNTKSDEHDATFIKGYKRLFTNTTLELISYLIISIVAIALIYKYSRDSNGTVTCDNYIFNTYVYIILSFAIMSMIFIGLEKSFIIDYIKKAPGTLFIICFIILCVVRYLLLLYIKSTDTITANIIWLIGIVIVGFTAVIMTIFVSDVSLKLLSNSSDILFVLGFYSIAILIIFGLIMNYIPYLHTINWNLYGVILIYSYIVALIVGSIYITDKGKLMHFIKNMMFLSIIIFIVIIALNHINLIEKAGKCGKSNDLIAPDYPSETFNFIYMLRRLIFEIFFLPSIKI